jgi:signal transduction histidine kinase
VTIAVATSGGRLRLTIRDDGRGFRPGTERRGHGLNNLQSRAMALGGQARVESTPGSGTSIDLECSLT